MKLNSKIKTLDIVNSPVPLVVNLSGKFEISYMEDSADRSQLKTMLAQVQPREIVYSVKGTIQH